MIDVQQLAELAKKYVDLSAMEEDGNPTVYYAEAAVKAIELITAIQRLPDEMQSQEVSG